MYVCLYPRRYMHTYVSFWPANTPKHAHVQRNARCPAQYKHTYIFACTYVRIHTHVQTHVHTQTHVHMGAATSGL
jgi:hypothetical protein